MKAGWIVTCLVLTHTRVFAQTPTPTPSPEIEIRAQAKQALVRAMVPFDAALLVKIQEAHQHMLVEATSVKSEMQPGYIREQDRAIQAWADKRRMEYAKHVWAAISKVSEKAIEEKRWESLNQRLDELQGDFTAERRLMRFYRQQALDP